MTFPARSAAPSGPAFPLPRANIRTVVADGGWRYLVKPLIFRLGEADAETAHHFTVSGLGRARRIPGLLPVLRTLLQVPAVPTTVCGIRFPHPVGLAAGADKDGLALDAWQYLGLGFVEAGTVTAQAQSGNPRPRVFRLPASSGVINRMGFPNAGAPALAARVAALRQRGRLHIPLGISLGKSKITPVADAVADYLASFDAVAGVADYVAINISSPNTPGLRGLQDRGALDELVTALVDRARAHSPSHRRAPVPLLVKIAPDLTDHAIGEVLEVCQDRGVAGVIATNTTVARGGIMAADAGLRAETGGLSGAPLRRRALDVVRFVCDRTDLPVIGVGGILAAADGLAMLEAGARLLQIYTGMLYHGPSLVRDVARAAALHAAARKGQ